VPGLCPGGADHPRSGEADVLVDDYVNAEKALNYVDSDKSTQTGAGHQSGQSLKIQVDFLVNDIDFVKV
jgi:hypothetical protein